MVVSLMDSGTSGVGSVVFLGKVMFSHSASLHPGELIGTVEFYLEAEPCDGLASHPGGRRGLEILLVHSCYRGRDITPT